jgi:hypothetical protein
MAVIEHIPMPANCEDLTGRRFGRWTVTGYAGRMRMQYGNRRVCVSLWQCRCDCGAERTVRRDLLVRGDSVSCGCYMRAVTSLANTTHGHCGGVYHDSEASPTYHSWSAMKERCNRTRHPAFQRYGGRGITVCDRWMYSFENFLADMGERPEGLSIDRIDNSKGYEPGNCHWATTKEQGRNRADNHTLTHNGLTLCLSEWAEVTGIGKTAIRERLRRGWSVSDTLMIQPQRNGYHVRRQPKPDGMDSS